MPAVESCITPLEKATAYLEMAVQGAKINYGEKNTVKGLHGVPSWRKIIGSVWMTLGALKKIKNDTSAINLSLVVWIQPKSLVTLIEEHFNSKMREFYEVPPLIQNTYQFPEAVKETVKRITNCGFSSFTSGESCYKVPENMVLFKVMGKIPWPPERPGSQEDVLVLWEWANEYGKAIRQLSVQARSTKDNPGTFLYQLMVIVCFTNVH